MSKKENKKAVIGLDLGTSYSGIAQWIDGKASMVPNASGQYITPTAIAFHNGQVVIGHDALRQAYNNPSQTFYSIKRLMGKKYASIPQSIKDRLAYELCEMENGDVGIIVQGKKERPSYLMGLYLKYLVDSVSEQLGESITDVVITVPAYFDADQKQATKDAGTVAGLNVLRILAEPTAAAIAYQKKGTFVVFDLGGGTFDISIVNLDENIYDVLGTGGDTEIGGDDMTNALIDFVVKKFLQEHKINLYENALAMHRIREACETAKKNLSSAVETTISVPFVAVGALNIEVFITRAQFEGMIEHLVRKCVKICADAIRDCNISKNNIDYVLLVGGATRTPIVGRLVEELMGKKPMRDINPDEAVALGAAIQSGIIQGVTGHKDIVILDVTPLPYGIETFGGIFTAIIEKNTTIPTKESKVFTTTVDNQASVTIAVYQGIRSMVADNKLIGTCELTDIQKAPRGIPQIEVTFNIDSEGMLLVTAKDKTTNKEVTIRIDPNSGATKEEIDAMKRQAEEYKDQDIEKLNISLKRNEIDNLEYNIQKKIEKIQGEDTEDIKKRLSDAFSKKFNAKTLTELEQIENEMNEINSEVSAKVESSSKESKNDESNNDSSEPVNPAPGA